MTKKLSACPGWLDLSADRRAFIFNERKADVVRKIFELCIDGLGSYTIGKLLDRHYLQPFGRSNKWDPSSIDNILRSRAVLGEFQPKTYVGGSSKGIPAGDPIPGYYPLIIDEATFEAAQRARQRNRVTSSGRKGNNVANLFQGLTTCAYCGGPVKFHSNSGTKSLICSTTLLRGDCVRAGWSYLNFEHSVLQFITHPALLSNYHAAEIEILEAIRMRVSEMRIGRSVDSRQALVILFRKAISQLHVASAGHERSPVHPSSLVRRDRPERYFEIKLFDGPLMQGSPVLS